MSTVQDIDWCSLSATAGDSERVSWLRRVVATFDMFHGDQSRLAEIFTWRHLTVHEPLGEGSFGTVYRAHDAHLRRDVALKLLPKEASATEDWLLEARRLARVRHPHVIPIHGAEIDAGQAGIWMDLVAGQTLEQILKTDGRLSTAAVTELLQALVGALSAIHERGLVHGDVKAGNVMVEPDGHVVLLDFGAAVDLAVDAVQAAGSPLTSSPEVLDRAEISAAADIYSLGTLLFRCFTGRYPFDAEDVEELRHQQAKKVDLSDVPRDYRSLLRQMLRADPQRRPTASELEHAVQKIIAAPERRRRRWAIGIALSGLVVASIALGLGWIAADRSQKDATREAGRATAALGLLQDVIGASFQGRYGKDARIIDMLDGAAQLASTGGVDDPFLRATVAYTVGGAYIKVGRHDEGEALLEEGLQLLDRAGDANPVSRARVLIQLGLHVCEENSARSFSIGEQILGLKGIAPDHDVRRSAYRVMACAAHADGDRARSEQLLRQGLAIRPAERFPNESRSWMTQADLAEALRDLGRSAEARPLAESSYLQLQRLLGAEHDATLSAARVYSSILIEQSEFGEAADVLRATVAAIEVRRGANSTSWIAAADTLSTALSRSGEHAEALTLNARVIELGHQLLGQDHPFVVTAQTNRGVRLKDAGLMDEALVAMRASTETALAVLGPAHPLTLINQVNLAEVLLLVGALDEAATLAERALETSIEALGEDHRITSAARAYLGRILVALERPQAASDLLAVAADQLLEQEDTSYSALETHLAYLQVLKQLDQQEQAARHLDQVLPLARDKLGVEHPLVKRFEVLQRPD